MLRKKTLLFFFLAQFINGYGQHRIGSFMAYGSTDGLPASFYYTVLQSSDGYLWIGSSSGLVRFDGKNYKTFFSNYADTNSLSDNVINDIIEDDTHQLWIAGLYQGLSKYDLRTGKIKRYSRLSQDKTAGYGINRLYKDDEGQIWISTSGRGLAHYVVATDSFEFFIPDPLKPFDGSVSRANHISGIARDPFNKHLLWLSAFDGLYSFDTRSKIFQHYTYFPPGEKNIPLPFLCVETDGSGTIWLGTWYLGMIRFDPHTHSFQTYSCPFAEPPNSTHYLVLDIKLKTDSLLYLATSNSGLLSFHLRTHSFESLLSNDQLPDGSSGIDIQRVSLNPDAGVFVGGNYYIYQEHPSFNRFGRSVYFPYGAHFGVKKIVYDPYRSGYWVACTNAGEMIFFQEDLHQRKVIQAEHSINAQFVDEAIDRSQRVWVITPEAGMLVLDESKNIFRKPDQQFPGADTLANKILEIENDENGNLWMLTRQKLFHLDVKTNQIIDFELLPAHQGLGSNLTLCSGPQGDAWIATDVGVFHCRLHDQTTFHLVPDEVNRSGIANSSVKSMTIDHTGNAWLGFERDGIQVIRGTDHALIHTFNLNSGLPAMQINFMATDTAGGIWAGTAAGLASYNPSANTSVWKLFNREDGIKRDYVDRPVMATSNGKLFWNIEAGMSWIDIGEEKSSIKSPPILHLISFDVDGKPYRDDLLPDYLSSVELPFFIKEIRIAFAAMDWAHPGRTKYFYRIDGIRQSQEWIENNQATLTLTGMKSGKYLIRLFAMSSDGIKSNEFQLPMLIRTPFWKQWWFIMLCIMSLIGIGYAIYRYRIGQIQKVQAMRNTISTNLHDDIGASLSNIHILTVLTQRNISNPANATSYITKAGDEIQRISESLSDIVWNINPKYDDLDNLFIRMKRYAADMLDGKNIRAELIFPDESEKITMPMDQRRDFYLIFKEAINNLVKYSEATQATIHVIANHHIVRLDVNDNGKGFEEDKHTPGNGMQNMKQRAEKWKSVLQINSTPGEGTSIRLEMEVG